MSRSRAPVQAQAVPPGATQPGLTATGAQADGNDYVEPTWHMHATKPMSQSTRDQRAKEPRADHREDVHEHRCSNKETVFSLQRPCCVT